MRIPPLKRIGLGEGLGDNFVSSVYGGLKQGAFVRDVGTDAVLQRTMSIRVTLTEDKARDRISPQWLVIVRVSSPLPLLEELNDEVHLLFDTIDPFVQSVHPLVQSTQDRGLGRLETSDLSRQT